MSSRFSSKVCPPAIAPAPITLEAIARSIADLSTMLGTVLELLEDIAMRREDTDDSDYIDSD